MFKMNRYMYLEVNSNIYAHVSSIMNNKKLIDEFRCATFEENIFLTSTNDIC